jgi:hypothetical protein
MAAGTTLPASLFFRRLELRRLVHTDLGSAVAEIGASCIEVNLYLLEKTEFFVAASAASTGGSYYAKKPHSRPHAVETMMGGDPNTSC